MKSLTDSQWSKVWKLAQQLQNVAVAKRRARLRSLRTKGEDPDVLSLVMLHLRLAPEEESNRIGQKIGQFTLKKQVGFGGMGVVYLAEQDTPKREVIVKLIHPALVAADPDADKRFSSEVELLGRLEHIGIARIYAGGIHSDPPEWGGMSFPYFAMEYVRGETITAHQREQAFGIAESLERFLPVCEAIRYAHGLRVIHRDLKPEHILIDVHGFPRILDFGLAQLFDPSLPRGRAFLSGTPSYMSPEQVTDEYGDVGPWSDVYALGLILYELLGGRRPYEVPPWPPDAIREALLGAKPAKLGTLNSQCNGELEAIVAKAIHKNPKERYRTAAALETALRRHIHRGDGQALTFDAAGVLAVQAKSDGAQAALQHSLQADVGERKIVLEDTLEEQLREAFGFVDMITELKPLPQIDERSFCLTENYTDENIARFNGMLRKALDVLDQLIDIEEAPRLRLAHNERGVNMAALVLDYERETKYLEAVAANAEPTIDSFLVRGIAYANCGMQRKSIVMIRDAIRLFMALDEPFDSKSLTKFVYRLTRHVGCVFSNAQQLLSLVTFKNRERLSARLENSLQCLDEAMDREKLFDFHVAQSHAYYGDLLEYIGLVRHALRHYDQAITLGLKKSKLASQKVDRIRKQVKKLDSPPTQRNATVKVEMNALQMPNFHLELGNLPSDMEYIIRDYAPEFYRDIIEDDAIFSKSLSKSA